MTIKEILSRLLEVGWNGGFTRRPSDKDSGFRYKIEHAVYLAEQRTREAALAIIHQESLVTRIEDDLSC